MDNLEKYKKCFIESFSIDESALASNIEYNTIEEWDSIGHMAMIASLEETFDISMDIDDIIEFSSFEKGKELLKKYDVVVA
jgi:acyl carrier protein